MKKLTLILVSLFLTISSSYAQNAYEQYWAGDNAYNFYYFTGPDGNPAPDGLLIRIVLVGDNGVIDGLNPITKQPAGDDAFCLNNNFYQDHLNGTTTVGNPGTWYASNGFTIEEGQQPEVWTDILVVKVMLKLLVI